MCSEDIYAIAEDIEAAAKIFGTPEIKHRARAPQVS